MTPLSHALFLLYYQGKCILSYTHAMFDAKMKLGRRRKFLKQLGQELTNDYIQIHLQRQSCMESNVRNALKMIGKLDDLLQPAPALENWPGNVTGCVLHRSTRKHQEYAIVATGMCALPILLKW